MTQSNDFAIPEIKLVQSIGGDEAKAYGAKPGEFYCAITQEKMTDFEMALIGPAQKTRTYWGRDEVGDEPPTCASPDGINSVNGDKCATACPFKAFTDAPYAVTPAERRKKCLPNYNIIGIKLNDMMPVLIRCSGISALAARELNTLLQFHRAVRGQYYKAKIKVSAITKKNPFGESWAIKFGDPQLITDETQLKDLQEQKSILTGVAPEQLEVAPPAQLTETAVIADKDVQRFDPVLAAKVKEKLAAQEAQDASKMSPEQVAQAIIEEKPLKIDF